MEKKSRRKPMTLAARVAAGVMGWEVCRNVNCEGCDSPVYLDKDGWHATVFGAVNSPARREWDPIENPADLMDVLGELRRRGLWTRIDLDPDQVYVQVLDDYGELLSPQSRTPRGANTWQLCLARAVCRAAIEAVKEEGGSDA